MVASTGAPVVDVIQSSGTLSRIDSPETDASISRYLASGERVRALMELGWKVCAVLMVLVALAWAFGALPGAVKLF